MEFDDTYGCHCSLILHSGWNIVLDALTQLRTYAGLLEGVPTKWSNDESIKWHVERTEQNPSCLGKPLLINPERRDYRREPGDMQLFIDRQSSRRDESRYVPEWLPPIVCVGDFRAIHPVRDETKDGSSLFIIWFQDDFGFDAQAVDRLRTINWERHATDWNY